MDTEEIVRNLRRTIYKFTYAHKMRDQFKKLEPEDQFEVKARLRQAIGRPENADIARELQQIIT